MPTFTLNFLALIPLALILGDITEDLALRFGDIIGGLVNATFGWVAGWGRWRAVEVVGGPRRAGAWCARAPSKQAPAAGALVRL